MALAMSTNVQGALPGSLITTSSVTLAAERCGLNERSERPLLAGRYLRTALSGRDEHHVQQDRLGVAAAGYLHGLLGS